MSRHDRWCSESSTSTCTRVAAKPLRDDRLDAQRDRLGRHCVDRGLDRLDRHPGAHQRAEQHVAAGAGGGVDPQGGHRAALATRAANTPAPYPLSMLTTVTPGAQELSMASRAAMPPNEAP